MMNNSSVIIIKIIIIGMKRQHDDSGVAFPHSNTQNQQDESWIDFLETNERQWNEILLIKCC